MGNGLWRLFLMGVAITASLALASALEHDLRIPFDTSYRVACAALCLFMMHESNINGLDSRWSRLTLAAALAVNAIIFFTPLVDRPASRGELLIFGLPDAIIAFAARLATYRVADAHQRAVRQQIIFGLILAVAITAILFPLMLLSSHSAQN